MGKPMDQQAWSAWKIGYGSIALRREGEYVVVEIERNGTWYPVIRELVSGDFSSTIRPMDIEVELRRAGAIQ